MLRSRTIREGSVGLLAILGIIVVTGIVLWLQGIGLSRNKYSVIAEFPDVKGIQIGAKVRYRGYEVGRISAIEPSTNGVDVTIEFDSSDLKIPRDVTIQSNRLGLIGESSVDIIPKDTLPEAEAQANDPLGDNCNAQVILCNEDRVKGETGLSLDDLIPLTVRFSQLYSDPKFFQNLNTVIQNTSVAALEVSKLSKETTMLVGAMRKEINGLGGIGTSISSVANKTSSQLDRISSTVNKFGDTAVQFENTAEQLSLLATNVNSLVSQNRGSLVQTLQSLGETSDRVRSLVTNLDSTVSKVNANFSDVDLKRITTNLETLTANANEASVNLRDVTKNLNDPKTIVLLQQTLDSARATFENTQKITADLDELTGDPALRNNLRNLINGLGNLVSSTEQLQQQVETAKVVEPWQQQIKQLQKKDSQKENESRQNLQKEGKKEVLREGKSQRSQ
jgi:phospholipid/cholesterol/gamma-HCH transport system substrate-binding protein